MQLLCSALITGCDFNPNLARLTPRQTFPRLEAKGAWTAKTMEELLGVVTGGCEEGSVPKQLRLEVAASVCELIRSPLAFFDDGSALALFDLAPPRMVAESKAFLATFPEYVRPSHPFFNPKFVLITNLTKTPSLLVEW